VLDEDIPSSVLFFLRMLPLLLSPPNAHPYSKILSLFFFMIARQKALRNSLKGIDRDKFPAILGVDNMQD